MEITALDEMAVLFRQCLADLEVVEAAFIRQCFLDDPGTTLKEFAAQGGLSPKTLAELRVRAMTSLRAALAARRIQSIGDVL